MKKNTIFDIGKERRTLSEKEDKVPTKNGIPKQRNGGTEWYGKVLGKSFVLWTKEVMNTQSSVTLTKFCNVTHTRMVDFSLNE